jgi:ABC-2 type transport system permease protein
VSAIAARWRAFRREWRMALRVTRLNFAAELEYRANFAASVVFGIAWQASVLVFAGVLLTRFPGIGGWDGGGVLLIAAIRLLSHGIQTAIFNPLWQTSERLAEGMIDVYLVRPLPVYRQLLLSRFPVNAFGDCAGGLLLFGLAASRLRAAWTPWHVAYLLAAVAGGVLLEAALFTLLSALTLLVSIGFTPFQWLDSMLGTFGNYPLKVLPVPAQAVLTFVLPVAFISYLPAAVLTGRTQATGIAQWLAYGAPLAGLALYAASRYAWYLALRRYGSIGG